MRFITIWRRLAAGADGHGRRVWLWAGALALAGLCAGAPAAAQDADPVWAAIAQRGELVVGVKTDFAPFGQLDARGQPMGLEIDLAQRLGTALGVRVRLVPVSTDNRFMRLQQGVVDMLIATAGDTHERRRLATAVEPHYYASGVTVMLAPGQQPANWAALRGQPLCALQGSYFNRGIAQRHLVSLQLYRSVRDALLALQAGHCAGFLYTEVAIRHLLGQPGWQGYHASLPAAMVVPWSVYLPLQARGTAFEHRVGDALAQWHRDGTLLAAEARWGLAPSAFLRDAQQQWMRRDASGQWLCRRGADGDWPLPCRHPAFVVAADVPGLAGLAIDWRDRLGLDFSVLYDPFDARRFAWGVAHSLLLCGASIAGALLLGALGARLALAGGGGWRRGVCALAGIGRSTPLLLQMYGLLFGLGGWLMAHTGLGLTPMAVAIACLSAYHGCMIALTLVDAADVVRQRAVVAPPRGTLVAALFGPGWVGTRVALTNLTKASTVASAIAVPELLSAVTAIVADRGNVLVMMNLLLVCFFVSTWFWARVIDRIGDLGRRRLEPAR